MGLGTTVKLAVVVTGAITAGSLLPAGTAVGRKHAAKKHYTSSGHGTYESTGQACFGAKWAGTGGWKTSYKETTTVTNVGTTTDTANGHSSYSWDLSKVAPRFPWSRLLTRLPGDKPTGSATGTDCRHFIESTGVRVPRQFQPPDGRDAHDLLRTPRTVQAHGGMVPSSNGGIAVFKCSRPRWPGKAALTRAEAAELDLEPSPEPDRDPVLIAAL